MEPTLKQTSSLLINESPLQVLPSLAVAVGLHEAIMVQQIHYWLARSNNERDGRRWVYNSYVDWQKDFPFWSTSAIRRAIESLEEQGVLIAGNYNSKANDRTKWYTIDYERLDRIVENSKPSAVLDQSSAENSKPSAASGRPTAENSAPLPIDYNKRLQQDIEAQSAAPAPANAEPTKRRRTRNPKQSIPADFTVTDAMRAWAHKQGCNDALIDKETTKFIKSAHANGRLYSDWAAAWESWVLKIDDFGPSNGHVISMSGRPPVVEDVAGRAEREQRQNIPRMKPRGEFTLIGPAPPAAG